MFTKSRDRYKPVLLTFERRSSLLKSVIPSPDTDILTQHFGPRAGSATSKLRAAYITFRGTDGTLQGEPDITGAADREPGDGSGRRRVC